MLSRKSPNTQPGTVRVDPSLPSSFAWKGNDYEVVTTGWIVVYDDETLADEVGAYLATEVKHCSTTERYRAKRNLCWETFSIVRFANTASLT